MELVMQMVVGVEAAMCACNVCVSGGSGGN